MPILAEKNLVCFLTEIIKYITFERTPLVMSFAVDARARHVVIVCE